MPPDEQYVLIRRFLLVSDADLCLSVLLGHGIDAIQQNDATYALAPQAGLIAGGTAIKVHSSDVDRAIALLEDPPQIPDALLEQASNDMEDEASAPPIPVRAPERCPNCGSQRVHRVRASGWIWTLCVFLLLGLPWLCEKLSPGLSQWICQDCDWEWRA